MLLPSLLFSGLVPAALAQAPAAQPAGPVIDVGVGSSVIRRETKPIARVLISDPDVAELRLLEEGQYQIRGLGVGNTDLWVWFRGEEQRPTTYRVVVSSDLTDIERRITGVVAEGSAAPQVYALRDRLVVEGSVDDLETLERVAAIARVYDEEFVNLMSVRGDHQVQLRVVFAEVSRSGLRELGMNLIGRIDGNLFGIAGPNQTDAFGASRSLATDIPNINGGTARAPSAEAFNLAGVFSVGPVDIAAVLSVLEQYSLARTLAEPTLVALSGQQAESLVGGEIPIPIAATDERITIEFKEFGVKLLFVPTVLAGGVIDMRTYVEVSEIDPVNSTRLVGLEIPALTTRKARSHLRLRDGMTFAMAGILDERTTATRAAVPILGDLPIIGALFRYVRHERDETELVIFVTPHLVRPLAPGEVPAAPGRTERYNPSDFELFLLGNIVEMGSRTAEPSGSYGMQR